MITNAKKTNEIAVIAQESKAAAVANQIIKKALKDIPKAAKKGLFELSWTIHNCKDVPIGQVKKHLSPLETIGYKVEIHGSYYQWFRYIKNWRNLNIDITISWYN